MRDTLGSAGRLALRLEAEATQALLTKVAAAFHGGIDDVLLTALSLAVADWCARRGAAQDLTQGPDGAAAVLIDLEGHGREEEFGRGEAFGGAGADGGAKGSSIDLTRTVGWFTSLYPVRLALPARLDVAQALSGGAAAGRALKAVKEQLRAVPGKGLGYGVLRHLSAAGQEALGGQPAPQLGFN